MRKTYRLNTSVIACIFLMMLSITSIASITNIALAADSTNTDSYKAFMERAKDQTNNSNKPINNEDSVSSYSMQEHNIGAAESATLNIMSWQAQEEAKERRKKQRLLAKERQKAKAARALASKKQELINAQAERIRELNQRLAAKAKRPSKVVKNRVEHNYLRPFIISDWGEDEEANHSYLDVGLKVKEDLITEEVHRFGLITTDMYISLILETSLVTRRGASVVLVVENDVVAKELDPVTHRYNVLLPRGTRMVCKYQPLKKYGQTSVSLSCIRAYLPDGRGVVFDQDKKGNARGLPAYDQMGRIGVVGKLDNRLWEKYGNAFILAGIEGLAVYGSSKISDDSAISEVVDYSSLGFMQTIKQTLQQSVDLAPIVSVTSGTRIILRPVNDIRYRSLKSLRSEMLKQTAKQDVFVDRIDYRYYYGREKRIELASYEQHINYGRPCKGFWRCLF